MNNTYHLKDHLFLFDIDGTIIDSKGDGKNAFVYAFKEVFGIEHTQDINFLGGIDNVIFRNICKDYGLPQIEIDEKWVKFKEKYITKLSELSAINDWIIFPNTKNVIEYLYKNSNIGLVTGNIKKGAKIKLNKFSLDNYFECGGFGDVSPERVILVEEAINACSEYYEKSFEKSNIFLFGDTEIDINSAFNCNIIPVLIDHKKKYFNKIKDWKIKYYGTFINIEKLFKSISKDQNNQNIILFN